MDYFAEMNAFYTWLESTDICPASAALWNALMNIAYAAQWPRQFAVPMKILMLRTKHGKDSLYSAKRQLKETGRIEYYERKGSQSTMYTIIPFVSATPTQAKIASARPTQIASAEPTQKSFQHTFVSAVPTQTKIASARPTQNPLSSLICNKSMTEGEIYIKANNTLSLPSTKLGAEILAEEILQRIELEKLEPDYWRATIEQAVKRMVKAPYIWVQKAQIEQALVHERLLLLDREIVQYMLDSLSTFKTEISSPTKYIMACLFNAAAEYDAYLNIMVARESPRQHKLGGGEIEK